MDLTRMLAMCERDQWSEGDLDWSVKPRELSREHEIAICQYFTDMAGIELLAGALFAVQRDQTEDPTLRAIFHSFVVDEERHSVVAKRLARHYDVHHYREYRENPHLTRFAKHFVKAVKELPPDIANVYITTGELLLDIALLRSLDDFVDDAMSKQAMKLINRDESRHIAIDHHMVEHYASPTYTRWLETRPKKRKRDRARAAASLAGLMWHARPFFRDVFFAPMDLLDPTGARMREAFKRIQILGLKEGVTDRPFSKFTSTLQRLAEDEVVGPVLRPVVVRVLGVDERVLRTLYTDEEAARFARMSFDQLADEALAQKAVN
jgi:hypothetical protein